MAGADDDRRGRAAGPPKTAWTPRVARIVCLRTVSRPRSPRTPGRSRRAGTDELVLAVLRAGLAPSPSPRVAGLSRNWTVSATTLTAWRFWGLRPTLGGLPLTPIQAPIDRHEAAPVHVASHGLRQSAEGGDVEEERPLLVLALSVAPRSRCTRS